MNAIFQRVSMRKYTNEPVSNEEIEQLLRAGMAAPSANNQQPWVFYVVQNRELLDSLSQATQGAWSLATAPLCIIACSRKDDLVSPWAIPQDMSAAMENILLEATDLGLGSLWIGLQGHDDWIENVFGLIGKPEDVVPFGMVAIGHAAKVKEPRGPHNYDENKIRRL